MTCFYTKGENNRQKIQSNRLFVEFPTDYNHFNGSVGSISDKTLLKEQICLVIPKEEALTKTGCRAIICFVLYIITIVITICEIVTIAQPRGKVGVL
jgi:hypothetical protein